MWGGEGAEGGVGRVEVGRCEGPVGDARACCAAAWGCQGLPPKSAQHVAPHAIPRVLPSPPLPQGYFYVEAHKEAHVKEALKGLRMIYQSKPPKLVRAGGGAGKSKRMPCCCGVAEPGHAVLSSNGCGASATCIAVWVQAMYSNA